MRSVRVGAAAVVLALVAVAAAWTVSGSAGSTVASGSGVTSDSPASPVASGTGSASARAVPDPTENLTFEETGVPFNDSWGVSIRSSLAHGAPPPQEANATVVAPTVGSIPIPSEEEAAAIAFDPDNGLLYVTNLNGSNVTVVNGSTDTVLGWVAVGSEPDAVAFDPFNGMVYVANGFSDNVSVIDSANDTVVASVAVGLAPSAIAVDTSDRLVYVANLASFNLTVLNGTTEKGVASIAAGEGPAALAFDPRTNALYVLDVYAAVASVGIITGDPGSLTGSIDAGASPAQIAVDPANGDLYVTNEGTHDVAVINATTEKVAYLDVGSATYGVAYCPANRLVYVTAVGLGTVVAIDPTLRAVITFVPVGYFPTGVAYDAANGDLYAITTTSLSVVGAAAMLNGTSIRFAVAPGPWEYQVAVHTSYYRASVGRGTVRVGSGGLTRLVVVRAVVSRVVFRESGLPRRAVWIVRVAEPGFNLTEGATSGSVTFLLFNGTYSVLYVNNRNFTPIGPSSVTVVAPKGETVHVTFAQAKVVFSQRGLPRGTEWGVNVTGPEDLDLNGTSASLAFRLESGNYSVEYWAVRGYVVSGPTSLEISVPSSVVEHVTYAP